MKIELSGGPSDGRVFEIGTSIKSLEIPHFHEGRLRRFAYRPTDREYEGRPVWQCTGLVAIPPSEET